MMLEGKKIIVTGGGGGIGRANTVSPGQVRTLMTEAMFADPEIAAGRAAVVPMGRVGTPGEIAEACVFLLSDRAGYVTAANLPVDGGQVESKMIHTPGRNWGGKSIDDPSGGAKGGKGHEPV